jgi:hypothetical protein
VRMTFPQMGNPLPTIPNAKVQNFYVMAAQTDTPQGDVPSPIHDHTIQAAPGDPGWTPFMHGYFVVCSDEGLTSGCVAVDTDFGGGPLPLAKSVNGEPLTSAETIASTRACSTWSIRARCSSGPSALRGSEAASAFRTRRRSADVGLPGEWQRWAARKGGTS